MKIKEMEQKCHENHGNCKNCPLNCVDNWQEINETWCIMLLRYKYTAKYRQLIMAGDTEQAKKVMNQYKGMEERYMNK